MPKAATIALAILRVNWDTFKKDYVENFVPLIAECVRILPDEVVTLRAVQQALRDEFGLDVPQNAIKTILSRAQKHGYVRLDNKAYIRNPQRLAALDFRSVREDVLTRYDALVAAFASFAKRELHINMPDEAAEAALLKYIARDLEGLHIAPRAGCVDQKRLYAVARFLEHTEKERKPEFDYFVRLVQGNVLATVLFLPDPGSVGRRFRNTEVYFDTRFLIAALGYAGSTRKEPCVELIRLLRHAGAELRCFRHTRDEVYFALSACAVVLDRKGKTRQAQRETMEYFVTRNFSASDVEFLVATLDRDLRQLAVKVVDKPEYVHKYAIDEAGLAGALDSEIQYSNPNALRRDVDSIAAIMRLRHGESSPYVEDCRALFVTNNAALARVAKAFLADDLARGSVPPCITDHALTYLLWLKNPQSAPELPRKRIIADCYAAIQPTERLWSAYVAEVDRLGRAGAVTEDDYHLLRYSLSARRVLMELTVGEEAIADGTVTEVLQRIRTEMEADLRRQIGNHILERAKAEQALEHEELGRSDEALERDRRMARRANSAARATAQILGAGLLVLLFAGVVTTFPWSFPALEEKPLAYAVALLQLAILVLSVANLYWGTQVKMLVDRLERWLAGVYERRLHELAG